MGLLPGEWFVFPDLNAQLEQARAQVAMAMAGERTVRAELPFDLFSVLPKVQELFAHFFQNSLKLNLALTQFFATLLSIANGAFREDSETGLYQMLEAVCTTAKRRVGAKDGTIENIKRAYRELGGTRSEHDELFVPIVILLEFLKELNSIAQSRSLLMSRNAIE
jgi:hypothetical protein